MDFAGIAVGQDEFRNVGVFSYDGAFVVSHGKPAYGAALCVVY